MDPTPPLTPEQAEQITEGNDAPKRRRPSLYVQVLLAITLAVALGWWNPELAQSMKPLGDGFVKLIKMLIGPIVFTTVAVGIGGMKDLRRVGRVGGKALLWFELMTTIALVIGVAIAHLVRPGAGIAATVDKLDRSGLDKTLAQERPQASSSTCWRSFPTPSSAPSPKRTSSPCCSSRSLMGTAPGRGPRRAAPSDAIAPTRPDAAPAAPHPDAPDDPTRARRLDWATLLKRSFGIDALARPRCGHRMQLLAVIEAPQVAEKILNHLGLPIRAPPVPPPFGPMPSLFAERDDRGDYDSIDASSHFE